jgi:transposase
MRAFSMDLRERVIAAVEAKEGTYSQLAVRFKVSADFIKNLVRLKRELGTLQPQTHRCGRKPKVTAEHKEQLRELVKRRPDITLRELRDALGLDVSLKAIWDALQTLKLTFKKAAAGRGTGSPRRGRKAPQLAPAKSAAALQTTGVSG